MYTRDFWGFHELARTLTHSNTHDRNMFPISNPTGIIDSSTFFFWNPKTLMFFDLKSDSHGEHPIHGAHVRHLAHAICGLAAHFHQAIIKTLDTEAKCRI